MALRPCLDCGIPANGSRCEPHRLAKERARVRPSPAQRGYDAAWRRTSAAIRAAQPWCGRCGATSDLTVDHVRAHDAAALRVLCRRCHSAIGSRTDKPAKG